MKILEIQDAYKNGLLDFLTASFQLIIIGLKPEEVILLLEKK